jgi:type I restriction enzyme R subunit
MQYGHDEAVSDGVNVDFDVYRIRTRVTEQGATIEASDTGVYVDVRHKLTRAERLQLLNQDLTYTANQLDRDVVSESQIRTVLQQFRDRVLPDAFPGRKEVPKTLIFAKDDSHADDIVRLVREVFAQGNDFCQKITYRTGFTKFFLRNVKSAGFFEQMKGRGVRVLSPDKLRVVSPTATVKDRFIIVDAVGVCEQDKTDSHTLNRQPSKTLEQVLEYVAQGGTDPEVLTTLAGRLARLQRQFTPSQLAELRDLAGGRSFPNLAHALLNACDPDAQLEAARRMPGVTGEPSEDQVRQATEQLAQDAAEPFLKAAFRRRILEIRQQNEQTIDRHTIDDVLYAGFDAAAVEKARSKVQDFRAWIASHKDELIALQAIYTGTRPLKLSLADLRQLRDALARPPLAATPLQLWRAFEATDPLTVAEPSSAPRLAGEALADLVKLVRHAIEPDDPLRPYADEVRSKYVVWKAEQRRTGVQFTSEQEEWLDRMAEHIATSLGIEPEDFETGWFGQQGSLGKAHALFGERLKPLMAELNERLAA